MNVRIPRSEATSVSTIHGMSSKISTEIIYAGRTRLDILGAASDDARCRSLIQPPLVCDCQSVKDHWAKPKRDHTSVLFPRPNGQVSHELSKMP